MAKITFSVGSDEDRKTYAFDEDKILNVEAMAIEQATDRPWLAIVQGLEKGSLVSFTAIVWILRKREEPWLQFTDVQFKVGELGAGDDEAPVGDEVPKEEEPAEPN